MGEVFRKTLDSLGDMKSPEMLVVNVSGIYSKKCRKEWSIEGRKEEKVG